jgi:hypothetical protein
MKSATTITAFVVFLSAGAASGAPSSPSVIASATGRISVAWSLASDEHTWVVELAQSPAVDEDGNFLKDIASYGVDSHPEATSWTSPHPVNPGTYFIHVGVWSDTLVDVEWSPTVVVKVEYALRSRWFDLSVPASERNHALVFFDARQCDTMNSRADGGVPIIPASVTIRSSWRKRPAILKARSVCTMGDLIGRRYFGGLVVGSINYDAWNLYPSRSLPEDGTWSETLSLTGIAAGKRLGTHVIRVSYHNESSKRIWDGTDAFVNYCINHFRPIRSSHGRLYCMTEAVSSVRLRKSR